MSNEHFLRPLAVGSVAYNLSFPPSFDDGRTMYIADVWYERLWIDWNAMWRAAQLLTAQFVARWAQAYSVYVQGEAIPSLGRLFGNPEERARQITQAVEECERRFAHHLQEVSSDTVTDLTGRRCSQLVPLSEVDVTLYADDRHEVWLLLRSEGMMELRLHDDEFAALQDHWHALGLSRDLCHRRDDGWNMEDVRRANGLISVYSMCYSPKAWTHRHEIRKALPRPSGRMPSAEGPSPAEQGLWALTTVPELNPDEALAELCARFERDVEARIDQLLQPGGDQPPTALRHLRRLARLATLARLQALGVDPDAIPNTSSWVDEA